MSVSSRSTSRREQMLLDWALPAELPSSPEGTADRERCVPPEGRAEALNSQASIPENAAIPKLSPGAAAIIHAHLPPADVEQSVEGRVGLDGAAALAADPSPSRPAERHGELVQVLPWDFRTSFPEPLEEAIEAGKLTEDDAEPENLKALHEEHARHALVLLWDLDAVLDARRCGIDPRTGRPPKTPKQRERLDALFHNEPGRLEREFDLIIDVYEEAFGAEAADAFRKVVRAWHAGVDVITERPPHLRPQSASVQAGIFGREEDGTVIQPAADEVGEIIEQFTNRLTQMPDGPKHKTLLSQCAEDFGEEGAEELDRWSRLKSEADDSPSFSYDPGHPWHYYHEGDGAEPLPLDAIPARAMTMEDLGVKFPKNAAKRRTFLEQMLAAQSEQLAHDEQRYQALVDGGVEALSQYDREIAHGGNDDLAWASAIALKYTHISGGRGRVRCLEQQLAVAQK